MFLSVIDGGSRKTIVFIELQSISIGIIDSELQHPNATELDHGGHWFLLLKDCGTGQEQTWFSPFPEMTRMNATDWDILKEDVLEAARQTVGSLVSSDMLAIVDENRGRDKVARGVGEKIEGSVLGG